MRIARNDRLRIMDSKRIAGLRDHSYDELVNNTIEFWVKHAVDRGYGGFTFFVYRRLDYCVVLGTSADDTSG